ncbi:MAG: 16S rRNA (guanine(527)-N(7))-methyltransferase [Bacteroidetes bacterium RIFCSPLOWO2_12_FULL_35_15]|nr:MAG: 16S rRNA (guanine(527)-N(7))-methyltransferase [Bacteroidetes bacterium RIFCSPLOWO2_12_FULL_35_15]
MSNISIILKYFPNITKTQQEQFAALQDLFTFWNAQINVISRKDIDLLYERHVLHSLGIAKVIQFNPKTNVMDIGCGGGFPGIPLAIIFPETNFYLVDSIGKKIKVVNEVALALGLKNVKADHIRAEEVKEKFEFIISRAVTEFPVFYRWVQNKISKNQFNSLPNGILYLKGGDLTEEFKDFKKRVVFYDLKDYFSEEFFETKKVVYLPM